VTEDELNRYLARGYEDAAVEFKGSRPRSDKLFLARVVRAVLGMANHRDGGLVILGVEDSSALVPIGITNEDANTWLDYDGLSASINEYASPCIRFEPTLETFWEKNFVFIRVHQFDDIPILCAKDYNEPGRPPILRRGACYVRARHKPETSEIPSEEEMRELLELAIDKGLDKFVTRARRAGLLPTLPATSTRPSHQSQFEKQIEEIE
jgi:predicted HTH transcriptional regulator